MIKTIDRASELRVAFLVGTRDLVFFASDDFGFASDDFGFASETNQTLYLHGRGGEIRTHDLRYPKPSRYQAAPRPANHRKIS